MPLLRSSRLVRRAALRAGIVSVLSGFTLMCGPGAAEAQPWTPAFWKPFGVSVNVARIDPTDSGVDPTVTVGVGVGFFPHAGWGPAIGLGWFETDVRSGGLAIGRLRARPVLGGVGYTWRHGRLATKVSVTAGIIFNHFSLDQARLDEIGGQASIDVHNSFAVRSALTLEYSLVRKLAVKGTVHYLATRPSVVATTPQGETSGSWKASSAVAQAGLTFYPFR
jgi:hypothetical protein